MRPHQIGKKFNLQKSDWDRVWLSSRSSDGVWFVAPEQRCIYTPRNWERRAASPEPGALTTVDAGKQHSRCQAPLRCSSKCILCFRASVVGALERITCTLQLYHYFLLSDTHTTAPGGLVCSTQQHSPLHANSGVMSPAWARSSSTTLFFSASTVHFCIAAANKIK